MSGQLPSALPLVNKGYSLEADMLTGWRPPNIKNPYPLYYDSDFDYPSSKTCVYSGYKPEDSFEFHSVFSVSEDSYPFDFSQPSITAYLRKKGKKPSQVEPSFSEDVLIFDSKFECGNLDHVEMINKNEYDLYMRLDTNTDGHMHWFYFSVSGLQGRRLVKFNIVNFTRNSNLFTNGMKPRVFSVQEVRNGQSAGWQPGGENVQFSFSKLNRHNLKKPFYQLSFSYLFQYANDKVWFATSIPYTYSRLQKIFRLLKGEKNSYITTSTLCKSLSLIDIPLITVTNPNIPSDYKKTIVAIGRIHPAETVGSWVMEGFLRFLASKHPEAVNLRNSFIFKIVPMLNPDGVIVGNCRTSLSGNDLNRTYIQPSEEDHPEIVSLKKLVEKLQEKGKVFMFFDMHGHFSKKGSFLYGPYFPIHHSMYYKSKIIPRLISERTEMFRFYSCKFRISKSKKRAARAVMSSEFQINHSYTLETSYHGYFSNSRETLPFTPESLFVLGEKLARSINEYSLMLDQSKSKLFKKQGKHFLKFPEDLPVFEEFDFEIPHLSFVSTTSNNKAPNDCFSNLAFRTEKHVKRNLDEWMNIMKSENVHFPSSSSDSGSELEEKEEASLPPIEVSKKIMKKIISKKVNIAEVTSANFTAEETSLPAGLAKEIKKIHEFKRIRYADTLVRPQITPKKLMDVRNRSTNPYISVQNKDEKRGTSIRESFRPSSLKPFTARNDERKKVDCIFSNLAYV